MNSEKPKSDIYGDVNLEELNKPREEATDMELALFLSKHINNPCEAEVAPGQKENIRGFYLREAQNVLAKMTDENAKKFLELKIAEYEK
jgi:hypothetical protein